MKIKDIMTTNVQHARPNHTFEEVANQMKTLNVGSIPICDETNSLLGIVTDRDIVTRGLSQNYGTNTSVGDVMTEKPITITPDASVSDASALMSEHQIRRLPVVDRNKLVGIVSIGDLAVRDKLVDKAGDALSDISEPSRPQI